MEKETNWASLKGTILSGGFELEDLLEGEALCASFKVRVLGDRFLQAVARFFQVDSQEAERQLAIWEGARLLHHPNLLSPLGSGQLQGAAGTLIYIVASRADESLAGVLPERALTVAEAGEVLTSAVRGLTAVHAQGYVHGCVGPEQVLAIGDSIQFPTDCIRPTGEAAPVTVREPSYLAPESAGQNVTAAADVWCLGVTLFETLTQRRASASSREESGTLPGPFQHVVPECLHPDPGSRCSLNDALAIYRGELVPKAPVAVAERAPEAKAAAIVEPVVKPELAPIKAEVAPVPEPVAVEPAVTMPLPAEPLAGAVPILIERRREPESASARHLDARHEEASGKPSSNRWVLWVGLAAAVLLVFWALRARGPRPTQTAAVTGQKSAPAAAANSWETRTLSPDGSAAKASGGASRPAAAVPAPKAAVVPESHAGPATVNGQVWRLVVYTYNRPDDASRKVESEKTEHPQLGFEVFSPSGHGGPYLVVAGGRMTREEAAQLRRKAVGMGLPRDSYIQNYKR